ncbi:GTPase-activating protein [Chytridiales sp. JEL 0842]|nr:GTPase-activating protein [Chytridiales sp. JEL 0842]
MATHPEPEPEDISPTTAVIEVDLHDDPTAKHQIQINNFVAAPEKDSKGEPSTIIKEDALGQGVVKEKPKKIRYKELFRYATRLDRIMMTVGMLFSCASGIAMPLTTIAFGNLVNVFALPPPITPTMPPSERLTIIAAWQEDLMSQVRTNSLFFLYLAVGSFVATYIYMALWITTGARITHHTRENYLKAVLRQNIGWHDSEGAGEVATRITTDMHLIQDAISEKVPVAASQFFTFLSAFGVAFYRSFRLTLVLLSVLPFIVGSVGILTFFNSKFQTQILNIYSQAGSVAEETISALRTVTAFNAQKKMCTRYDAELGGARAAGVKKSIAMGFGLGFLFMVIYFAYALAFYYGSVLLQDNLIDAGTVVNVFFSVLIGAFSLGQIAPEMQAIMLGVGAGTKIFYTLNRIPPIDTHNPGGETIPADEVKGNIELKKVVFTYPARPDVKILKGIDLSIKAGTTVALVGQSGSGKSTIIQLLERFYDAESGTVELDGRPLTSLNLIWLRHQIGYVSQEPTLFEGTVAENVSQGLLGTAYEQSMWEKKLELVKDACRMANAHDFILKLPQGYETQVGERGLLLSGGQKQRIAIARAIVKNPKILLLDEATSALDTTSERIVQAALDNAAKGRTTIVIAHRLSTIKNADQIICMARGEIIEQGSHDELVSINGFYKKLVDAQQLIQNENEKKKEEEPEPQQNRTADRAYMSTKSNKLPGMNKSLGLSGSRLIMNEALGSLGNLTTDEEAGVKIKKNPHHLSTYYIVRRIFSYNRPELAYIIVGVIASTISGLVMPAFAVFFSTMLQSFSDPEPERTQNIRFWAAMFVVIGLIVGFANYLQTAMFGIANEYLTERIRKLLFKAMLRQDVAYFDDEKHTTGVLTSKLSEDAQKVQGAAGVTLGTSLQLIATFLGGTIISLIYGWKLGLLAICCLPVLVIAAAVRMTILKHFADKSKEAYEQSAQVACEAVAAIRTVQSLTAEGKVFATYSMMLDQPLRDGYRNATLNTLLFAFSQSANFLTNAIIFYYGGHLIAYEGYSLRNFFVVLMSVIFGAQSAGRIFAFVPDFNKAKSAAVEILDIVDREPPIDSESTNGDQIQPQNVQGVVEFKDVRFVYPTRPNIKILRGLNVRVKPGQFVALVGSSGCGKSTTIGLLERFYDPLSGEVTLDGKDIKSFQLTEYRNVLGLVSQEPNLFDISIADNICFGLSERPSQEQIEKAAKEANIHDFIMTLPEGYNTRIGSKGSQLSGGQKQRIAIARALIKNPKVLLLDEATSALDAESEKVVQGALDKAAKGRTTIAIAHRLSSIQHADVIYVLKDGQVAEKGTHQELYDMKGLYHELVVQQDLEKKKKKEGK